MLLKCFTFLPCFSLIWKNILRTPSWNILNLSIVFWFVAIVQVKVSITRAGSKKSIVLRAGNGRCELDITDTIAHYFGKEIDKSHKSTDIINFMSRTSTIVVLSFAALLILASGWMCIGFRRKHPSNNSSKYQRLEMELPVSGEVKTESATNEGWDNSWGDDWDDEEAPKTPSLPVTPSLSSKGLASRRLSKEGWKD